MGWPIRFCSQCGTAVACDRDAAECACTACGTMHYNNPKVCAGAAVCRDGQLLLVQRRRPPNPGTWDICGGYVSHLEHPRETARREVLEETGLTVEMGPLVDVVVDRVVDNGDFSVINIYYLAESQDEELKLSSELNDASWFSPESLPTDLTFSNQRDVLARAVAMARLRIRGTDG